MLHAELQLRKALLAQPQSQRRKEISSAQVFDNYGLWWMLASLSGARVHLESGKAACWLRQCCMKDSEVPFLVPPRRPHPQHSARSLPFVRPLDVEILALSRFGTGWSIGHRYRLGNRLALQCPSHAVFTLLSVLQRV